MFNEEGDDKKEQNEIEKEIQKLDMKRFQNDSSREENRQGQDERNVLVLGETK